MNSKIFSVAGMALCLSALPAMAHHSFSMYDQSTVVEYKGVVKEYLWTNPHCWIKVVITDEHGQQQVWGFVMNSPSGLIRYGWRPDTVAPGDSITIYANPRKDNSTEGFLQDATLQDGRRMTRGINQQ